MICLGIESTAHTFGASIIESDLDKTNYNNIQNLSNENLHHNKRRNDTKRVKRTPLQTRNTNYWTIFGCCKINLKK